jgi:hypothetical protein
LKTYAHTHIYIYIYIKNKSWLNCWPEDPPIGSKLKRASKFESSSQFKVVNQNVIPTGTVWKALPGWITLTRRHAQAIVDLDARFR